MAAAGRLYRGGEEEEELGEGIGAGGERRERESGEVVDLESAAQL